jgi:hypothetical protein
MARELTSMAYSSSPFHSLKVRQRVPNLPQRPRNALRRSFCAVAYRPNQSIRPAALETCFGDFTSGDSLVLCTLGLHQHADIEAKRMFCGFSRRTGHSPLREMAIDCHTSRAIGISASVHEHFDLASFVPSGSWQGKARATANLSVGSGVNAA